MKKISVEKYIEGVESIYVEQPSYRKGGDGSDGTCDCIGMNRGGSERAGATDIKNFRGTNQAARKTIEDLKPIRSVSELELGCVVLKTRDKDDKSMPLPDKYRKGGSEYDPTWGETNFTHIGTVTGLHPLEITHMTSPTAKKDTSLKNWKYSGWLPWVTKEENPETDPGEVPEADWATVIAESGSTVKMRAKPSASCRLYWDVPVGSQVIVNQMGTPWTGITWAGQEGYMMTKFLLFGDEPVTEDLYIVTIPNLTKSQAEDLCRQWGSATMEKG